MTHDLTSMLAFAAALFFFLFGNITSMYTALKVREEAPSLESSPSSIDRITSLASALCIFKGLLLALSKLSATRACTLASRSTPTTSAPQDSKTCASDPTPRVQSSIVQSEGGEPFLRQARRMFCVEA